MIGVGGANKPAYIPNDININKIEIERLQRLCSQQANQLSAQENMIRELRSNLSNNSY